MKRLQSLAAAAVFVCANAQAAGFQEFISKSHDSFAEYNYAEADLLLHPDDYTGIALRGSYVFRPNIAALGRYNRLTADVGSVDTTSTLLSLGARYFFAASAPENTDIDLLAYLTRATAEGGGISVSDTGFVLGGQMRHVLGDRPIGSSTLTSQEVYGGLRMGFSDGNSNATANVGFVIGINEQFSANVEYVHDDGSHLALGVRMRLAKPQRNPMTPKASALKVSPAPVLTSEPAAPVEYQNPYGLTPDELADLDELAS